MLLDSYSEDSVGVETGLGAHRWHVFNQGHVSLDFIVVLQNMIAELRMGSCTSYQPFYLDTSYNYIFQYLARS